MDALSLSHALYQHLFVFVKAAQSSDDLIHAENVKSSFVCASRRQTHRLKHS